MARLEVEGIDELISDLMELGNLDDVAPKMINAATPVMVKNMKRNIKAAANRGYATGELAESIRATKAKQNIYGYFAAVGPVGTDSKGTRNAEKMAYLEYGTSNQQAHPVMEKTMNDSEEDIIKRMQQIFDKEAKNEG